MSYEGKPIYFFEPAQSTPQIKAAMNSFLESWLPKHDSSEDLELYHYTTSEGLKGILSSRSIWFTHTSTLNDPLELRYGKHLILEMLDDAINNETEEIIKILLKNLSTNINAFDTIFYETYVACFCESENLLSQWRSYASRGGGYNLGLRFRSNTKFYHTLDDSEKDSHVILRKMRYNIDEQKELVSNYISSIVASAADAIKHFKDHDGIPDPWPNIAAIESVNILFDLMLSFKNSVFSEEKEWRLIVAMDRKHRPELLKFRETNEGLVPYLEMFIVEDLEGKSTFPLQSIKIGPMLDEARNKSTLKLFMIKESVSNHKIKIDANTDISGTGYTLR